MPELSAHRHVQNQGTGRGNPVSARESLGVEEKEIREWGVCGAEDQRRGHVPGNSPRNRIQLPRCARIRFFNCSAICKHLIYLQFACAGIFSYCWRYNFMINSWKRNPWVKNINAFIVYSDNAKFPSSDFPLH